ncbi:MAG: restriction endonuclease subunit S, partial [Candidatus Cryptobacteroides sp.]
MNGKQLKNSILQWAIQGKLVPQDPNDEPASVLLERIRAEKARLVKEGKIKKDKNESIIFRGDDNSHYEKFLATGEVKCIDDEIPFEIPQGWEWCRLGAVLEVSSARRVHEKDWRASGVPFYRAREIGKLADYGYVDNDLFIDKSLYDDFAKSGIPRVGDLMMTAVGTLGKTYVVTDESPFYYKDGSVLCIGNPHCLNPFFIKYYFESSIFSNQYVTESDGTTVATLTMVRLNRYFIPIPPLLEQQRIVDIIKKLAPYITKYEETQSKLNILNNSVAEKLKKSILQDAIQGRLVPQIAEEGTAQELLAQIQQEKARLVKEGKLKKKDITDSVIFKGDDNKYYERINGNLL